MGTDPENIERRLNNARIRRRISRQCIRFLAVGATSVEGFDAELRHRFNGIVEFRAPILMRKQRIFPICKPMRFCSAVNRATTTTKSNQTYTERFVVYMGSD